MKTFLVSIGLATCAALGAPVAMAQGETAEPPAATTPAPGTAAVEQALDGFHVIVLQDGEGGIASARNEGGEDAILAFINPEAAEAASKDAALNGMTAATLPLMAVLSNWEGAVIFESSPQERQNAASLGADGAEFLAPTFFVTTEGQETQVQSGGEVMTPVLLSYDDAVEMTSRLKRDGVEEADIAIVPIELSRVLQEIMTLETDRGYRVFTHPGTVELINAMQQAAAEGSPE